MRRVLILDDDPAMLRLLKNYLQAPSLHLVTCSEIEAAECLMEHVQFEVLISDLEVSNLGGLEGMRLIRHASTNFPEATVIVFSGKLDEDVSKLARLMGATDVLRKPADLQRVRELVNPGLDEPSDPTQDASLGEVSVMETLAEVLRGRIISALLQPIVSIDPVTRQWRVFGVEGLARGPEGSLLRNPEILLGYASRKEMLLETELQCIEAVVREARLLPESWTLFINVFPRSLSSPDFAAALSDLVRRGGLRESQIVLEVTEQQTILNPGAFSSSLCALRERGFSVALDDYGQGFANLHLVEALKPDYLKIDGFFCRNIQENPRKQALVRSTAAMAQELGIQTIMEHVESRAELEAVSKFGVTHAQGYYFSRPAPARDLADWLT